MSHSVDGVATNTRLAFADPNGGSVGAIANQSGYLEVTSHNKPEIQGVGLKVTDGSGENGLYHNSLQYTSVLGVGLSRTVFLSQKTCIPLLLSNQFVHIPTTGVLLEMSSSNIGDIGQVFYAQVYDDTWVVRIVKFTLNGHTPVPGLDYFTGVPIQNAYRFIGGFIAANPLINIPGGSHAGDIAVYPKGVAHANGLPVDLGDCMATGFAGGGQLYCGYVSAGPGVALYPSQQVQSVGVIGKDVDLEFRYWVKSGDSGPWFLAAIFFSNTSTTTGNLEMFAFPNINPDFTGQEGAVNMLTVQRTTGAAGADDISAYVLTGYTQVANAT